MILVIHGSDLVSSRDLYFEEKNKTKNPIFLNGEGLTFDELFQKAENKNFLDKSTAILIENFFSKNKSNTTEFKKIFSYISTNRDLGVIFWENSEVSKTILLQLKNATVKNFPLPQNLFPFLDNIKPQNTKYLIGLFNELEKNEQTELTFFMIVRQFRLLLSQTDNGGKHIDEVKRLAPWQVSKLKRQLSFFDNNTLIAYYNKLFEIELGQKSGKFPCSLRESIDFFLTDL